MNVWAQWFVGELAWKALRAMLITPVLIGSLVWLGPYLALPPLDIGQMLLLAVSVVLGYLVCFALKLCIGMLVFWTTDINGTMTLYDVTASVFGGVLVPLTLKRLGFDPALAGGVILTTVTDVMGFLVFLGLATLVLLR